MKRILTIMAAVICLCSCAKIIDWVPVTFQVRVQDAQGKDLLDPANDNSWLIGTKFISEVSQSIWIKQVLNQLSGLSPQNIEDSDLKKGRTTIIWRLENLKEALITMKKI